MLPFLQEMMGGAQKPTAQEMAGGIPQNADPGKAGLLGMRGGDGLMGLRGKPGAGPSFSPPPVQGAAAPDMSNSPAQMMPEQAVAPTAAPPAAMGGMGGPPMGAGAMPMGQPPQMQANPALLQALMQRQQGMGAR